jgi:hypothetical protein
VSPPKAYGVSLWMSLGKQEPVPYLTLILECHSPQRANRRSGVGVDRRRRNQLNAICYLTNSRAIQCSVNQRHTQKSTLFYRLKEPLNKSSSTRLRTDL